MQRLFDLFFSILSLLVLTPLFLIIIIVLKTTGEGEIFFFQQRVGKEKRIFKLIKFATMKKNSPYIGSKTITVKNDKRILPFGKFLRKTKINELPQLLNVFIGDMSLVGPRPLTPETFKFYPNSTQNIISSTLPGLSGIGSIFFRSEEELLVDNKWTDKNFINDIYSYKGKLELWYINNKNLSNYFKVILVTIWIVIFPKSKIFDFFFKDLPKAPVSIFNVTQ